MSSFLILQKYQGADLLSLSEVLDDVSACDEKRLRSVKPWCWESGEEVGDTDRRVERATTPRVRFNAFEVLGKSAGESAAGTANHDIVVSEDAGNQ